MPQHSLAHCQDGAELLFEINLCHKSAGNVSPSFLHPPRGIPVSQVPKAHFINAHKYHWSQRGLMMVLLYI